MKTTIRRRWGDDGGAAAVEFALIMPMLVLMLAGIADLGQMVYVRSVLESAARAGAQASFADPSATATIEAAVQTAIAASGIANVVTPSAAQACECSNGTAVDCTTGTCAGTVRHYVTVTATTTYTPMVNITNLPVGLGVDLTTPLTGSSVIRAQ